MKRALILVFVLALAAATIAFAGCGDGGGSSTTPEQVVEEFLAAAMEGDAGAAYALITEESKSGISDEEDLVSGFSESISGYEVGKATISGDKAMVPVSYQFIELESGLEFNTVLVQENGAWKISIEDTNAEAQKALEEMMQELETAE
ncbi:MAG: DUF4878 domain-containing protein [Actinobacteria bacterium]|jgi:hypothetical protein|nr:MAG: DUF4878 domain-containing protein [Actinomycetota bacterium]